MGYMLRYDEIIEASKKYDTWKPHTFVDAVFSKEQLAFIAGANWADLNPMNAKIRELHPDFTVEDVMELLTLVFHREAAQKKLDTLIDERRKTLTTDGSENPLF